MFLTVLPNYFSRGAEQHLSIDSCLSLLSDYKYHLTMVLTIKEKIYINVKEEEEKEGGAENYSWKKIVGFDHNSSEWKYRASSL